MYTRIWVPQPTTKAGQRTAIGSVGSHSITYGSGKTCVVRNIDGTKPSSSYAVHGQAVTSVKATPSGGFFASGDSAGSLKVWTLDGDGQVVVKLDLHPVTSVRDVAWDGEGQRVAAVGDSRAEPGGFFSVATGTSLGQVAGHSKTVNAVALTQKRPFYALTGGDDRSIALHKGVPFKYERTFAADKVIHDVKWVVDGDIFAAASGNSVQVWSVKGDAAAAAAPVTIADFDKSSALTLSTLGTSLVAGSASGAISIADVEAGKVVHTYEEPEQIVGSAYLSPNHVVSVGLSGIIKVWDPRQAECVKSLAGHQSSIVATPVPQTKTIFTGDIQGAVRYASVDSDSFATAHAPSLNKKVVSLKHSSDHVAALGLDSQLALFSADSAPKQVPANPPPIADGSTASDIAISADSGLLVAKGHVLFKDGTVLDQASATITALDASKDLSVYGAENGAITVLPSKVSLGPMRAPVTALAINADGDRIAAGDSQGKILVYDAKTGALVMSRFAFHTARITALEWKGSRLVSGSLDTNVYVWSLETPSKYTAFKGAHPDGVSSVSWLSPTEIVSAGADATVKVWPV